MADIPEDFEVRHQYHRRVEFADTDLAGIAHFTALFRYLEEAEHDFLRSIGLSVHLHRGGETLSWPRKHVEATFHHPARFEETLRVFVAIGAMSRKTVTYLFQVYGSSGDTAPGPLVATGKTLVVCCRVTPPPIAPVAIPEEVAAKLLGQPEG